jgi:hypothetical protein
MRIALAAVALSLLTTATSVAAARAPLTQLLATAHGRGSVMISAPTTHLHGRVWLIRQGGTGTASGKTTVACDSGQMTATGKGYSYQWFAFRIGPSASKEVWRHGTGGNCVLLVSLTGHGLLTVSLRGY